MTNLLIEKFIASAKRKNKMIRIHFRKREAVTGLFIVTRDYNEMKSKNFWRIVDESRQKEWLNEKNLSSSRLFCGDAFARLSDV